MWQQHANVIATVRVPWPNGVGQWQLCCGQLFSKELMDITGSSNKSLTGTFVSKWVVIDHPVPIKGRHRLDNPALYVWVISGWLVVSCLGNPFFILEKYIDKYGQGQGLSLASLYPISHVLCVANRSRLIIILFVNSQKLNWIKMSINYLTLGYKKWIIMINIKGTSLKLLEFLFISIGFTIVYNKTMFSHLTFDTTVRPRQ